MEIQRFNEIYLMLTEPPRYEIKICCPAIICAEIEAWVRTHRAHWQVRYPPRQVNNIYFDTLDCAAAKDNLDGVGERQKLRLRWYGPSLERVTEARIEVKGRKGAVGWKAVYVMDVALDLTRQTWSEIHCVLRTAVEPHVAIWLAEMSKPTLINSYRRSYYATPDGHIRMTLDTTLRVYDQRFWDRPNISSPAPLPDIVIMEWKVAAEHLPRLADLLADFPFRPSRHSKYVQGLLASVNGGE